MLLKNKHSIIKYWTINISIDDCRKTKQKYIRFYCSGAPSPQYSTGHGEAVAVPVGPGFPAPRPIEEQTEPVDFSTANEPVNFSGGPGIRPVPGFPPPGVHVTAYSRESTPDSGGSHYMDAYRDPTGELSSFIV